MELTDLTQLNSALIALGLLAFAYLSWQKPLHGVYLICALLPVYLVRPTVAGLPTTVLELGILILAVIWFVKGARWKKLHLPLMPAHGVVNAIPPAFRAPLALFFASAFIGMLISANHLAAFGILKAYFIEPAFLLIIVAYEVKSKKDAEGCVLALGASVMALGVLAVWQYTTGLGIATSFWSDVATRRATTVFGYPNAVSLMAAPIVALYMGFLARRRGVFITGYAVMVIALGLTAIVTAQTAGALIAIGIVSLLMLLRYRKTKAVAVALIVIALSWSAHHALSTDKFERLQRSVVENHLDLASSSLEIRINQWRETLEMLATRPVLGAGLAGYQAALVPFHRYDFLEIYLYPHNIFLNFWSEIGLLGLIAFIWISIVIARSIHTVLKGDHRSWTWTMGYALGLAWLTIYLHGLVDVPYFKNDLSVLLMIVLALTMVSLREKPVIRRVLR